MEDKSPGFFEIPQFNCAVCGHTAMWMRDAPWHSTLEVLCVNAQCRAYLHKQKVSLKKAVTP